MRILVHKFHIVHGIRSSKQDICCDTKLNWSWFLGTIVMYLSCEHSFPTGSILPSAAFYEDLDLSQHFIQAFFKKHCMIL